MEHLSEIPEKVFLTRQTNFVVGVDLGKTNDYTAIAILEHKRGVWDEGSPFERHTGQKTVQRPGEFVHVRWLERMPLGMPYDEQVEQVKNVLRRPGIEGAKFVLDETGPGAAVADLFDKDKPRPVRVHITGGTQANWQGNNRWTVAKTILVSTIDAMLHTGTLQVAPDLQLADVLKEEFKNFRRKLSNVGNASYGAREGKNDDLVLAVSIGCWFLSIPQQQPPSVYTADGRRVVVDERGNHRFINRGEN